MPTGRLIKTAVNGFGLGDRDQFLWDDQVRGFGLRVTAHGVKSYVLQYRIGGGGLEHVALP